MDRTPFAGLTRLAPGESLDTDNASFQSENPTREDRLLEIGAVTHRHDGHEALADPVIGASAAVLPTGGSLPGDQVLYVGYTLLDADGGETLLSPVEAVSTEPPADTPDTSPTAVVDYTAGSLLTAAYYYAVTLIDGSGGETPLSDNVRAVVEPGHANARIMLSDLSADIAGEIVGWRLWRSINGAEWYLMGTGAGDTFVDDGSIAGDCTVAPPLEGSNTTNASQLLTVDMPADIGLAVGFRVYVSPFGDFGVSCLVGTYPAASAGATLSYAELEFLDARPPAVSTSIPGASRIASGDIVGLEDAIAAGGTGSGTGGGSAFTWPEPFYDDFSTDQLATEYTLRPKTGSQAQGVPHVAGGYLSDSDPGTGDFSTSFLEVTGGPSFIDGEVTAKFRFASGIGSAGLYVAVSVDEPNGRGLMAALDRDGSGAYFRLWNNNYETDSVVNTEGWYGADNLTTAQVPVNTDLWLRVRRSGMDFTAELFDADPDTWATSWAQANLPISRLRGRLRLPAALSEYALPMNAGIGFFNYGSPADSVKVDSLRVAPLDPELATAGQWTTLPVALGFTIPTGSGGMAALSQDGDWMNLRGKLLVGAGTATTLVAAAGLDTGQRPRTYPATLPVFDTTGAVWILDVGLDGSLKFRSAPTAGRTLLLDTVRWRIN